MIVELNGTTNGIAIMVNYLNNKKPKFICTKDNKVRLFNNLSVAKTVAKTVTGIERKIKYFIVLGDKMYPVEDSYKSNSGRYKIVDTESNQIITVAEKIDFKATNFSYIVFENGDTIRCDKKYGYNRSSELFEALIGSIQMVFIENQTEYGIDHIEVFKSEIVVKLKNCTAAIHIHTNSNIMDLNQIRKEEKEKVFPFVKEMDKFLTFYCYISRDISEPLRIKSEQKALEQLKLIVDKVAELYPETPVKLSNIEYSSYIYFTE